MIRFRTGQRWKAEGAEAPTDAFGLELDGVDILSGAGEESLLRVVPGLIEAVHALQAGGRLAEVSLPEAHLELVMERLGSEVDLEVVSLGRPARRLRGPIRVEAEALTTAAVRCARNLMAELREHAPHVASDPSLRTMMKTLQLLQTRPQQQSSESPRAFTETHPAQGEAGFGFVIDDARGRLHDYSARSYGGLPSLLFQGALSFAAGGEQLLQERCNPFLAALELSRQGADLVHGIEVGDERFAFKPAGLDGDWVMRLSTGTLNTGRQDRPLTAEQLATAMFELGQQLGAAVIHANKAQAKNPYVQELLARCREGMSQLRAAIPKPQAAAAPAAPSKRPRKATDETPIAGQGRLRRLRFEQRWSTEPLGVDESLRLALSRKGPIVFGSELALAYGTQGRIRFRRASVRGVALHPDGYVLTATSNRIMGFIGEEPSSRWFRDHDGAPVGPELFRESGRWITTSKNRSVLAFDELTGRELWRVAPSRTQKMFLTVADGRVIVGTDGGHLFGLSLMDGAVIYRLRTNLPFDAPALVVGRKLLARVGTTDRVTVLSAELETGALHWSKDLPLSRPTQPLPSRDRIYVAGEQGGDALIVALGKKGDLVWNKRVHLGAAPYSLTAVKRAVLVTARTGAAALVDSDGRVVWRIGAQSNDEISCDVPAVVARGVAVIAGPVVRAVDVATGEVLAEVKSDPGLCDLKVDRGLGLFLLYEDGTLASYKLSTHFAVV